MSRKLVLSLTIFAVGIGAAVLVSTSRGRPTAPQKPPPPSVTVAPVEQQEVVEWDEFTEIRAPIAGRVSRALVTQGNYVSGLAGGATMLTTIVSIDPIYVYADMDENSLLRFNALARARQTTNEDKIAVELQLADEGS